MGTVTFLSGPVGAGKTTVARELVALLPAPLSYIEGDAFWAFVSKPGPRSQRENFPVILRAMTAAALPLARSGFDVVVDFSTPPEFLPTAAKILKEVPFNFVVVCPSLAVCEERAAGRSEGRIADYAPYRSFHRLFDAADGFVIRDDRADAGAIAARIQEGLASGRSQGSS